MLTIEKMVALAAMPSPMETMAARATPGDFEILRKAYLRLPSRDAMETSPPVCARMSRYAMGWAMVPHGWIGPVQGMLWTSGKTIGGLIAFNSGFGPGIQLVF